MAVNFTPLQLTLGIVHCDLRLVCSCLAMETNFMKLLTNSYCADLASRGSLELSECYNRGQTIYKETVQRSTSVGGIHDAKHFEHLDHVSEACKMWVFSPPKPLSPFTTLCQGSWKTDSQGRAICNILTK
jgi:hypothetical protein